MTYLEEILEVSQELKLNPYVTQMEKLSESLKYLTQVFREKTKDTSKDPLNEEHMRIIENHMNEKLCSRCDQASICKMKQEEKMDAIVKDIFKEVEEYGAELSVAKKRELEKQCYRFEEWKEEILQCAWNLKNNRIWKARLVQSQDASLIAMQAFVRAIEEATREIDASMFEDEYLERKIIARLKKMGVRTLKVVLFMSCEGRYEVQISAKAKSGVCVTTNQIARVVSHVFGRGFMPEKKERLSLREIYSTIVFVEKPRFQTFCAVEQQTKNKSKISGDNFLVTEMPNGKLCTMISDGMGSGERAYKKSKMLLELAEKLLESNISPRLMIEMMNVALITEVRELEFATLDLCILDPYSGELELIKAGSSATYIVTKDGCKYYEASSLPVGVLANSTMNQYNHKIEEDCYIVMVTDGVNEAIKEEKRGFIYKTIQEAKTKNAKELAAYLLEKVVALENGVAKDDMMILVLGVWELQFRL